MFIMSDSVFYLSFNRASRALLSHFPNSNPRPHPAHCLSWSADEITKCTAMQGASGSRAGVGVALRRIPRGGGGSQLAATAHALSSSS